MESTKKEATFYHETRQLNQQQHAEGRMLQLAAQLVKRPGAEQKPSVDSAEVKLVYERAKVILRERYFSDRVHACTSCEGSGCKNTEPSLAEVFERLCSLVTVDDIE